MLGPSISAESRKASLSRTHKLLILIGLIVGSMSPTFYSYARGNALTSVLAEFNGMPFYAICSIAAVLTMAVATPIAGRLGAMFGYKRLQNGSSLVFCASLAGCAVAPNTGLYIFFIALSGAAQGVISALATAIIADVATEEERPKYVSYSSTASTLVQLAGPLLSGLLIDTLGWRTMFLVGLPFPIISFLLLMFFLPDMRTKEGGKQRVDILGAVTFLGSITPVLILLSLGGTMIPWTSGTTFVLLAAAIAFAVLLFRVDTKHEAPMISFYMFKNSSFFKLFLATLLFSLGTAVSYYLPYYFQNVLGTSAALSGTLSTPRSIATIIATAAIGAIISKSGKYKLPLLFMLGISGVTYAAMALLFTPSTSIAVIVVTTALNGLGNTAMIVVVISMVMQILPPKDIGVGVSLITFVFSLASSLGNAIGGLLTNTAWAGVSVPTQLQSVLTPEQLGQLSSASILKNPAALEAIRSGLSVDLADVFDATILSFREVLGHGVSGLFWVMAVGSLIALVLILTVKLPEKQAPSNP